MKKKCYVYFFVLHMLCVVLHPQLHVAVKAEDFSDTSYWNNLCTNSSTLTEDEQKSCQAYIEYMQTQNTNLQNEMASIDAKREEIAGNINQYASEINNYNMQIASLNEMINDLNIQINATEQREAEMRQTIENNQKEIVAKEEDIEQLKERIQMRMVQQQETMRLNEFINILMGTKSFSDFLRVIAGINDIYASDQSLQNELNASIVELNTMNEALAIEEAELEQIQAQLQGGRAALAGQQTQLLASRYEAEIIVNTYNQQLSETDEKLALGKDAMASNQSTISNIKGSIEDSIVAAQATPEPTPSASPTQAPTAAPTESATANVTPTPEVTPTSTSTPTPTSTPAPSNSISFDTPEVGETGGNPYWGGWNNCTWGCWQLVHDLYGISLPGWGWSTNWITDAQNSGYATGSTPRAPCIGVYQNHVALVVQVAGDQVYIKEGNYLGHYCERWVPIDELPYTHQKCLGFIYL